eukprot:11206728-Lingulodinium_polyedra.AAC.2
MEPVPVLIPVRVPVPGLLPALVTTPVLISVHNWKCTCACAGTGACWLLARHWPKRPQSKRMVCISNCSCGWAPTLERRANLPLKLGAKHTWTIPL